MCGISELVNCGDKETLARRTSVQAHRGLFRPGAFRAFVDEHRRGVEDWFMQIWQSLTLELWMQTFLDGGAKRSAPNLMHVPQAATA